MAFAPTPTGRDNKEILDQIRPEDLLKYGLIPEFVGRLPVTVTLESLDETALMRILTEPKNALLKQYQRLISLDDIELEFEPDAIAAIARQAMAHKSGARGLRAIIEKAMLDTMFDLPSHEDVRKCVITKDTIEKNAQPLLITEERAPKHQRRVKPELTVNIAERPDAS